MSVPISPRMSRAAVVSTPGILLRQLRTRRGGMLGRGKSRRRFHDQHLVPSQFPGMNECCVSMALGVWSCKRIEDLHEAAGDLYHHDRMGCGRVTEQMTLDPDDWGVAASAGFPEVSRLQASWSVARAPAWIRRAWAAVSVIPSRGRPKSVRTCPSVHIRPNPVSTMRTQAATHEVGCSCAYQVSIHQCHRRWPTPRPGGSTPQRWDARQRSRWPRGDRHRRRRLECRA